LGRVRKERKKRPQWEKGIIAEMFIREPALRCDRKVKLQLKPKSKTQQCPLHGNTALRHGEAYINQRQFGNAKRTEGKGPTPPRESGAFPF
jgi:hypothetical protein